VNVLTAHNDIARTGQNLQETILTPANVNPSQFGKLFSQVVSGPIYAQPLYVSQVAIPNKGTHNVVYVATSNDWVYAFDADSNGGVAANPLWQVSLLTNTAAPGTYKTYFGVAGTPVIDPTTHTMYLISSEAQGTTDIFRMHALDITTGAEKFGGPVTLQATVAGTGTASTGGMLTFNPQYHYQRPGLLLLNGVVYAGFGSVNDVGPWHGWIFSFNAATLKQIDAFCLSPNGSGAGVWMGGAGLAAEVNDPSKPYGRMFVATGNGSYDVKQPYNRTMNYGMSVLDLDLTGGVMTVTDEFTPFNELSLDYQDGDLGAGGPVLLPAQTLASGTSVNTLVQIGKSGTFYILNRNNLGGYNASSDQVQQEVQTPIAAGFNWGAGVWGTEAYWNGNIYSGGTDPTSASVYYSNGTGMQAYSFSKGVLSSTPTSETVEQFTYPGPTPAVSANGTTNGIVWALMTYAQAVGGPDVLLAYDATNLGHTLYSSNTNIARDNPGPAIKYTVPTVVNGKVYVGANGQLSVFGLLADTPVAPAPVISPGSGTYTGSQKVTITDSVAGATIYYTTDGSVPTNKSAVYSQPFTVTTNETITAIASPNGYLQSPPALATYVSTNTTANPVFSLEAGSYTGAQTLAITDATGGATIYYTTDGTTPTTASPVYTQPVSVPVSETVRAIAVAPGLFASAVVSIQYTIAPAYAINFSNGFTFAQGPMTFNGTTDLDDFRLQLTNGGLFEAGSAFFATPVNVQAFTTDFTFQLSNPVADGATFTIQNISPKALGALGGGLGYAGIGDSVALKFDLHNNAGEGPNSTGLFLSGAEPTGPGINLTGTGIDLHSGDYFNAHLTYDGTNLNVTLTDPATLATWTRLFPIDIPSIVVGKTAYVGFTAGTGAGSASQKVTSWTYLAGPPPVPSFAGGFDKVGLTFNGGAALNGTRLRLTDGGGYEARSAFFTAPVNIQEFSTNFEFQLTNANSDGFTFTIEGVGPTAVGQSGGNLGYTSIPNSLAVKFDLHSNEGEGSDSTGLYTDGAVPTEPSIDLTSTGVNLHSGDIFNAQFSYDGTNLTVVITDTVTNASVTQKYPVNIPAIIGSPTAYVGFTAGTGGTSAIQEILNWNFTEEGAGGSVD
jgi:hypothetical protein